VARQQPLIAQVRGRGLLIGIELAPATRGLATALTGGLVNRLSRHYFAAAIMMRLIKEHQIITAFTLNDPNVLRLEPPLTIERTHLDRVVTALEQTLQECGSFARMAVHSAPVLRRAVFA
jgi:putrescine aminotransferase